MNQETSKQIATISYHDVIAKVTAMKDADISKLERLIQLQNDLDKRLAAEHYNHMMAQAQGEMEAVIKQENNPAFRSRYADLGMVLSVVKPVIAKYGIAVEFDEDLVERDGWLRLVAYVSCGAERRKFAFMVPVSTTGPAGRQATTLTHARIGAVTYGRRTLIRMIFNVAEEDDDGNVASGRRTDTTPLWSRDHAPLPATQAQQEEMAASVNSLEQAPAQPPEGLTDSERIIWRINRCTTGKRLQEYGNEIRDKGLTADMFPGDKAKVDEAYLARARIFGFEVKKRNGDPQTSV